MLKYIGSSELIIPDYGKIKSGDIIDREDLCEGLKNRPDFKKVKTEGEAQPPEKATKKSRR